MSSEAAHNDWLAHAVDTVMRQCRSDTERPAVLRKSA
jgi:hypothetical protein